MWNLNKLTLFSIPLQCQRYQKKFETSRTSGSSLSGTPENGSGPFMSKKIIHIIGFMGPMPNFAPFLTKIAPFLPKIAPFLSKIGFRLG